MQPLQSFAYDRIRAVEYAHRWAYFRNPDYYDFTDIGGDCTCFASQCIYAGSGVMNHTPVFGWYYKSSGDRTASWTGVQHLYNFLTGNEGIGPWATEVSISEIRPGDIVQLAITQNTFHHCPFVVDIQGEPSLDTIYVAAHTIDCDNRPLGSYDFRYIRFLHVEGVRLEAPRRQV